MRNKILFFVSFVVFIIGYFNIAIMVDSPISLLNFIISLFFLGFWITFMILSCKNRKMMIYLISFWSLIFLTSVFAYISIITQFTMGAFIMPVLLFISPLYGIRFFNTGPFMTMLAIAIISGIFTGLGIMFTIKSGRKL
jgi:hypothetical protein